MSRIIFAIGYEQATQAALVATLRDAAVAVLADIRYLPLSRRSRRCFSTRLTL